MTDPRRKDVKFENSHNETTTYHDCLPNSLSREKLRSLSTMLHNELIDKINKTFLK